MVYMLPESGKISMLDVWRELNPPTDPKDCDYYFETREDFDARRDQIIAENNDDLSQKTFGFGDGVTDLSDAFASTLITSTPKMIVAKNVTDFYGCFSGCSNITSTLPDVWNKNKFPKITDGRNYAYDCTKASNYNEIPSNFGGPSTNPAVPLSIKQIEKSINK